MGKHLIYHEKFNFNIPVQRTAAKTGMQKQNIYMSKHYTIHV